MGSLPKQIQHCSPIEGSLTCDNGHESTQHGGVKTVTEQSKFGASQAKEHCRPSTVARAGRSRQLGSLHEPGEGELSHDPGFIARAGPGPWLVVSRLAGYPQWKGRGCMPLPQCMDPPLHCTQTWKYYIADDTLLRRQIAGKG